MHIQSRSLLAPGLVLALAVSAVSPLAAQAVKRAPDAAEKFFGPLTQLTFDGENAEAYFSADGKRLILQRHVGDSACDQEYTINVDGSNLRRISSGLGRTTCGWFYDRDQRVIYASTEKASPACPRPPDMSHGYTWGVFDYEIYSAKPDGSDLRQLTNTGNYNAEATLSPDGKRFVFTSLRSGDLELYTMNTDGTGVVQVTHQLGYDGGAAYSPDGKQLVWRAWHPETDQDKQDYTDLVKQKLVRPTRMELWLGNVDGTNARQITHLGGANFGPYFTPEGKRIIFSSNYLKPHSREFHLYLVNLDGTGLTPLTTAGDFNAFPQFSPDGKKLVFVSNRFGETQNNFNIFIADWKDAR